VQEKTRDKRTFCGRCFKNKENEIFKCWDSVVVCPFCWNFWLRAWLQVLILGFAWINFFSRVPPSLLTPLQWLSASYGAKRYWSVSLRPIKILPVVSWPLESEDSCQLFSLGTLRWFNPRFLITNAIRGQNSRFTSDVDVYSHKCKAPNVSNVSCLRIWSKFSITYLVEIIFVITDALVCAPIATLRSKTFTYQNEVPTVASATRTTVVTKFDIKFYKDKNV